MEVSHQPDCDGPDNHNATFKTRPFIPLIKDMPEQSVKQLLQPWRWWEEGLEADFARLHTKHLSLLVMTPSVNTHQLLLLVAFHTHTQSLLVTPHVSVSQQDQRGPGTKPCCASVRQSRLSSHPGHSLTM